MNDRPFETPSTSNSTKPTYSSNSPKTSEANTCPATTIASPETPQITAAETVSLPAIIITGPAASHNSPLETPQVDLHPHSESPPFSETPHPSSPIQHKRPPSQSLEGSTLSITPDATDSAMSSSSSSPSNTSTAGSTSGSSASHQLPYAPFPYPMPAKGQQQGGK